VFVTEGNVVMVCFVGFGDLRGSVGGVVVDDDYLMGVIGGLSDKRVEGGSDTVGVAVNGDNDRDLRVNHRWGRRGLDE